MGGVGKTTSKACLTKSVGNLAAIRLYTSLRIYLATYIVYGYSSRKLIRWEYKRGYFENSLHHVTYMLTLIGPYWYINCVIVGFVAVRLHNFSFSVYLTM